MERQREENRIFLLLAVPTKQWPPQVPGRTRILVSALADRISCSIEMVEAVTSILCPPRTSEMIEDFELVWR